MHFGLILFQIGQKPTAAPGFSEVSSDLGPGSPQWSLRVLKLKPWRSWASSPCSPEATPPFQVPSFSETQMSGNAACAHPPSVTPET